MTRFRSTLTVSAACAALLLSLSGCGADDGAATRDVGTTPTTPTGATSDPAGATPGSTPATDAPLSGSGSGSGSVPGSGSGSVPGSVSGSATGSGSSSVG